MSVIENLSIEGVYDKIAEHFDNTRYSIWTSVKNFIDNFETNAKVLEIGCGNGKNMLYRNDLDFYGIDISIEQINICKKKHLNVKKSNMISLPFNNSEFDNIICIATYHHLDNDNDRKTALYEMYRVLRVGGKILITVWAMEQDSNSPRSFTVSDEIVPWKCKKDGNTYLRYYHIYKKGELSEEINRLCPELQIITEEYDNGNWFIILTKPFS